MGRPPSNGGPAFRFNQAEVAEMEAILRENDNLVPKSDVLAALSDKFSQSAERAGKVPVQIKQVWNWFQNRRYALRAKVSKPPGKLAVTSMPAVDPARHVTQATTVQPALPGRSVSENPQMEFEAKSARDGAWYDVQAFLSHRHLETGDPEVFVRFAGFGTEEDEWINIHRHVRQRSLPCESTECVAVLPGDLILCFQEGREQALYFDAHVLDAQRRRHDIRGCRCRFLVRYDHDQSEEIVPLRKVCRRPETDYRLHQLHSTAINLTPATDQLLAGSTTLKAANRLNEAVQANQKSVLYPIIPGATVSGQISMTAAPPVNFATELKKVESGNLAVCSNTATGASMATMNETTKQ